MTEKLENEMWSQNIIQIHMILKQTKQHFELNYSQLTSMPKVYHHFYIIIIQKYEWHKCNHVFGSSTKRYSNKLEFQQ